ncbi:MAG: 2-oxo-4-hydroxy-4-carboxy-5-ureidoimidazoline decarboxylase [Acidobacteria bacterium]|nr:2-oxo-4-hydroxy-4-carboxy-5-ureidoimidazoline decarboxylase [Acidobacteriota bacterium]
MEIPPLYPALDALNAHSHAEAVADFRQCCGATTWAEAMAAGRPYDGPHFVHLLADTVLDRLAREDWLEAFAAHPRIGKRHADAASDNPTEWSEQEQAGMADANASVRDRLAAGNEEYFERFGYIFLICATGRTAEEMLAALEKRLQHEPDLELGVASAQQRLITHLRLDKLLAP